MKPSYHPSRNRSERLFLAAAIAVAGGSAARAEPGITFDLRVHDTGAKTAQVFSPGDIVLMDLFAILEGSDSDSTNDGLSSAWGSFRSSSGGLMGNLLALPNVAPFNANASSPGTQNDLDGDGDLDVGKTSYYTGSEFAFRASKATFNQPSGGFLVGQVQFLASSLSASSTEINWFPDRWLRPGYPDTLHSCGLIWLDGLNPALINGLPPQTRVGQPVIISATSDPGGDTEYRSGTVAEHLTVRRHLKPSPDSTLTLAGGLTVLPNASATATAVTINDDSSSAGDLFVDSIVIGSAGTGVFTQSAGYTSVDRLTLGSAPGAEGAFHHTGGKLAAAHAAVGAGGTALFKQTGGISTLGTLDISAPPGHSATYELSGDGQLNVATAATLGVSGKGAFVLSGGAATFNGKLIIGGSDGSEGVLQISGGTLQAHRMHVGEQGPATVVQNGGKVTMLVLHFGAPWGAPEPTGPASYTLNTGTLDLGGASVHGRGELIVNGGQVTVRGGTLHVASALPGVTGLQLHAGTVTTHSMWIGDPYNQSDIGTVVQDGGLLSVDYLETGIRGRYQLSAGAFTIGQFMRLQGQLDFQDGAATLHAGDKSFVNLSQGEILNAANATIIGGEGSLISFPANFDPLADLGHLSTLGLVHIAGQPLLIPSGKSVNGSGEIAGNVTNAGLLSPGNSPGAIAINGDYVQSADGRLRIELAGATADLVDSLAITGSATLAGLIEVALLDDFIPQPADRFTILTAHDLAGRFSNAADRITLPQGAFDILYTPTSVVLANFAAIPEPVALIPLAALFTLPRRARRSR